MYTGTMIEELIQTVERAEKKAIERTGDPYLDLAEVKTRLADRQPMTAFDEAKWWKADRLQQEVLKEPACPTNTTNSPSWPK